MCVCGGGGALTLSHAGPREGLLGTAEAQLPAHHAGRLQAPAVVAHRPPLAVLQDLHAALPHPGPPLQPHVGLERDAEHSASRLASGTSRLASEASRLASGTSRAASGTGRLASETSRLASGTGRLASEASMLASEASRLASGTSRLASETSRAASGTGRLASETSRLASETSRLASGTRRLASEMSRLASGTSWLASEASRLASGTGRLASETSRLAPAHRDLELLLGVAVEGEERPGHAADHGGHAPRAGRGVGPAELQWAGGQVHLRARARHGVHQEVVLLPLQGQPREGGGYTQRKG